MEAPPLKLRDFLPKGCFYPRRRAALTPLPLRQRLCSRAECPPRGTLYREIFPRRGLRRSQPRLRCSRRASSPCKSRARSCSRGQCLQRGPRALLRECPRASARGWALRRPLKGLPWRPRRANRARRRSYRFRPHRRRYFPACALNRKGRSQGRVSPLSLKRRLYRSAPCANSFRTPSFCPPRRIWSNRAGRGRSCPCSGGNTLPLF